MAMKPWSRQPETAYRGVWPTIRSMAPVYRRIFGVTNGAPSPGAGPDAEAPRDHVTVDNRPVKVTEHDQKFNPP